MMDYQNYTPLLGLYPPHLDLDKPSLEKLVDDPVANAHKPNSKPPFVHINLSSLNGVDLCRALDEA